MSKTRSAILIGIGIVLGSVATALVLVSVRDDPEQITADGPKGTDHGETDITPTPIEYRTGRFERDISGTGTLSGIVNDVSGAAVASARVRIHLTDQPWQDPDPPFETTTDADGSFVFTDLDPSLRYQIWAMAENGAVGGKKYVSCGKPADVVIEEGVSIALRFRGVSDQNEPIRIQLAGTDLWPIREFVKKGDDPITIGGLKEGEYVLWVETGELAYLSAKPIVLKKGEDASVDVNLAASDTGTVRVVDARGEPIGARPIVTVKPPLTGLLRKTLAVNDQGIVQFRGLLPGAYTVSVDAPGYAAPALTTLEPGVQLTVTMTRGATASGQVRTRGGDPIHGATLSIEQGFGNAVVSLPVGKGRTFQSRLTRAAASGWPRMIQIETNLIVPGPPRMPIPDLEPAGPSLANGLAWQPTLPDGTFTLDGLPSGRLLASATHPEYVAKNQVRFTLEPGEHLNNLVILMRPGTNCTARTVDDRGYPIEDVEVRIYHPDGELLHSTFSQSDGFVTIGGLPGSFRIEATADERLPAVKDISGRVGRSMEVELRMPMADQILYGRVLDGDGFGVENAGIAARSTNTEHAHVLTGVSDDDGSFALEGAGKDPYRVTAEHPEHGTAESAYSTHRETVELVLQQNRQTPVPIPVNPRPAFGFGSTESLGESPTGSGGTQHSQGFSGSDGSGELESVQTSFGEADRLQVTGPPSGVGGLPIKLRGGGKRIIVSHVPLGSQVADAGLSEGDRILAIDGKNISGLAAAKKALIGPIGSIVLLKVSGRDGPYTIVVQRIRVRAN